MLKNNFVGAKRFWSIQSPWFYLDSAKATDCVEVFRKFCFGNYNKVIKNIDYTLYDEDIYVGYRYFNTFARKDIAYPFGYGLSYTDFTFDGMTCKECEGGWNVKVKVTNKGKVAGKDVVQLYVKVNGDDAAMRLRGFDRIAVPKGQTVAVTLNVPEEDLRLWDMDKHSFELNKGESQFMVGASSADKDLQGVALKVE